MSSPAKNTPSQSLLIPAILVFTGAVLFSSKAILIKLAFRYEVDAVSLLALRMLFALPIYLAIAYWAAKNSPEPASAISKKEWAAVIALGLVGYYLASLMDFLGLQYVSASIERLILFTYPTIVLIFSALIYKEKINGNQLIALLLTYTGIGFALAGDVGWEENPNFLLGASMIFFSAFAYAFYLIFSSQLLPKFGNLRYTSWIMISAAFGILSHHAIQSGLDLFGFPMPVYGLCFLMAVIATVIPSFLVSEGWVRIGASNTSIIGSIGPVSTIILAYVFLGERLTGLQWIGTALVITGVLVISLQKNKKARQG